MSKNEVKYLKPGDTIWIPITASDQDIDKDILRRNKDVLKEILLSSMQIQNIMVLAGSGTSLGINGAPSMSSLWNDCLKNGRGTVTTVSKNVLRKVKHKITEENIESLLSKCEAYLQYNTDDKLVVTFVQRCKKTILEKCGFRMEGEVLNSHNSFIHKLSRRRTRDSRLKLFTTNYDLVFENAASNQGIVVIDGFSFSKPRIYDPRFFDYDIIRRNTSTSNQVNYLEGVFQLYKLHGSITWKRTSNGNIIESDVEPQDVCMIFPAKGKYQQSYIQPHLELMARYLSSLRETNTCLIISGFGFNDDHLSEPIISAIQTNPHLKVIITDYKAEYNYLNKDLSEISPYWKKLFDLSSDGESIWFVNCSFNEFCSLIPDLRSLTPAENLSNNIKALVGNS